MASTKDDEIPELGDLIEIFRGAYQHWAIYIDDGFVVHFSPPIECAPDGSCTQGGLLSDIAEVKREKLSDVVGKDKYQINNLLDDQYDVQPISVIIQRARTLVGETFPYSVLENNCEHFVTEMRYGNPESCQVHNAVVRHSWFGLGLLFFGAKTSVPCSEAQKNK